MDHLSTEERNVLLLVANDSNDTKKVIRQLSDGLLEKLRDATYDITSVARDELYRRTDVRRRAAEAEAKRKAPENQK